MKRTEFSDSLMAMGLTDERAAVVLGVMDGPSGYGTCLSCVNGNTLRVAACGLDQKPQEILETVPLREIRILKASSFVLSPKLVFEYDGHRYTLTRFNGAKEFLEIIREEAAK